MFAAKLIKFWLHYKNDWLSASSYAEYHGMSPAHALTCINMGREYANIYKWHVDNAGEVVITGTVE